MKKIPYTQEDFAWIKWNAKDMKKQLALYVEEKKKNYAVLKAIEEKERNFENTMYALEASSGIYFDVLHKISLLGEVSPKKEIRDVSSMLLIEVEKVLIDIEYDKEIYHSLVAYEQGNYKKEKKTLSKEEVKLFTETIREYRRMGFDLSDTKQNTLKELLKISSEKGELFRKNINDYEDFILCTEKELAGLSERYIQSLSKDEKTGKYIISLVYPEIGPYLSFATNRNKRKLLAEKNLQKGGKKNITLLNDLVSLRKEIATLLGYAHHGDFRTENRMAKNAKTVEMFQKKLLADITPCVKKDIKALRAYGKKQGIDSMEHYDIGFIGNALKKELYAYDAEEVRQYFPISSVMPYMLTLFGSLFDITFTIRTETLWDKEVRLYEIHNKADNALIAYLAFDLFPRSGKYGHAMCTDTVIGHQKTYHSEEYITPFTTIVCNFPAPKKVGKKVIESVLSLGEIETLFHEFGHSLHMSLSTSRFESQSGANVAWDFVETPSQIMENWVFDSTVLKEMSYHVDTGEHLPDEIIAKIIAAKNFQNGYSYTRQIMMGALDMDLHTGKIKDANEAYKKMNKKYFGITLPEKQTLFPAGFGHLVGYDAGYYSYLWALVYACDAYSIFQKNGITNNDIGMRWRKEVLEKGSTDDEMKLIKNFLKRAPNQKAFLNQVITSNK